MSWPSVILVSVGVVVVVWAAAVLALVLAGRQGEARALARFIPDCLVLFRRLLGDPRVPRSRKAVLVAVLGYVALPIDLVPDFIPVAGQLDDVIIVGWALRGVLGASGGELLDEHWPGPPESLAALRRVSGLR